MKLTDVSSFFVVRVYLPNAGSLESRHAYHPYAKSQAETWRRMYPDAVITITLEGVDAPTAS